MVNPSTIMQSHGDSGFDLEAQLARKEREWKELQAVRVNQLEKAFIKAQEECSTLREHYQQLKEDFQFNLAILDERDRELEKYDIITARALAAEDKRQRELNQLHAHIATLEEELAREAEERQREKRESQHAAEQQSLQMQELKRSMAGEIQKQTEEYEMVKVDLQCKIQELEGEMTLQRQEMTATFDRELRQREQEINLKMDEMCALVMSHNLKVKLLSTENEVHCQAQVQATEALKASEEFYRRLQSQLQHRDREIKDITSVKDHRIKVLKDEVKNMETKLKEMKEDFMKKYESLVQTLKVCDVRLEAQYQAHTGKLQEAERHIAKLKDRMKVLAAQVRCTEKEQREALEQKDKTIQRLCTEVETTRTGWEKYMSNVSRETVAKDNEMIALQDRESRVRAELERSREDTERYKQQLCDGLKREKALEQKKVQVELEWQKHCEDMKAKVYLTNEKLIQELTQARDQAKAELKEKEQELQEMTALLRCVKSERDQAIQGLTPTSDSLASEQICRMREQNSVLRAVVTQMRKDMEHLSHPTLLSRAQPQASSPQPFQHPPVDTSITSAAKSQMATEPPSEPTDITSKVSHAEGRAETSLMKKQQNKVAPIEAAVTNTMQKNARVQQLQEENLFLRQQLASGLAEDVSHTKGNHPILHKKLKQAASCIARLSREKQQLIEIGNRLRAEITTAGLQEPMEAEKDTEEQQEQHDRLSALEQLQYQLTTQELQYALRQAARTGAKQLSPITENHGPPTNGTANTSHSHKTTDTSESCKNKENSPPPSQSQSSMDAGPQPRSNLSNVQFSSVDSLQSLKELWAKLDHVKSPSTFSEGNSELSVREVAEPGGAEVQMAVHGISAPIHRHSQTEVQQRTDTVKTPSNTTKTRRPGASGKIRNYSVKD
ncbi:coiled-coil domain-containing protein 57 isoform X1 [Solea solea]|uniref:coiled-coil domain-containing protein 57 isoform X1 n=2 Tax=Solea solea TaxID=90069 RepID=UPI00272CDA94|nr:coiled-coil domain-containing protein 57 isoform X1 [Solea solea]